MLCCILVKEVKHYRAIRKNNNEKTKRLLLWQINITPSKHLNLSIESHQLIFKVYKLCEQDCKCTISTCFRECQLDNTEPLPIPKQQQFWKFQVSISKKGNIATVAHFYYRGSSTYTKITNTVSTTTFFGLCTLWHSRLWSFQGRDTKLERFLAKNQLHSNEITKF